MFLRDRGKPRRHESKHVALLLRDRDAIYGREFGDLIGALGMEEVMTAPRSPWPNPYVERLVGSVRRESLDHVIVWNHRGFE